MAWDDPTPQQQAAARAKAIAAGNDPAQVDAFIAREGGARTSASRILTAFNLQAGSNPAQSAPAPTGVGGAASPLSSPALPSGPATTSPGTGSTDALNKVVEPATSQGGGLGAAGLALSAIGGGGAMGNQERTVDQQSGGVLRPLGMRRQAPMSMQVLQRRSY